MAADESRRRFIRGEILARSMSIIQDTVDSFREGTFLETSDYFDSFEHCHPLIAEAGALLLEEARERGIETDGRSDADIARELFEPLIPKRDEERNR